MNYTNLVLLLLKSSNLYPYWEVAQFFCAEIPCASFNLVQSEHLVIEKFVCHRSRFNKMEKRMSSVSRTRLRKLRTLLGLMCCDELFLKKVTAEDICKLVGRCGNFSLHQFLEIYFIYLKGLYFINNSVLDSGSTYYIRSVPPSMSFSSCWQILYVYSKLYL